MAVIVDPSAGAPGVYMDGQNVTPGFHPDFGSPRGKVQVAGQFNVCGQKVAGAAWVNPNVIRTERNNLFPNYKETRGGVVAHWNLDDMRGGRDIGSFNQPSCNGERTLISPPFTVTMQDAWGRVFYSQATETVTTRFEAGQPVCSTQTIHGDRLPPQVTSSCGPDGKPVRQPQYQRPSYGGGASFD